MNTDRVVSELRRIKMNIEKWVASRDTSAGGDPASEYRNAEELIWKFQERYGYIPDKQNLEQ